jgi:hypothetical protein
MLLPRGKLTGVYRNGTPSDFLKKDVTGYIQFSWKDGSELCIGTVVMLKGEPVLASVEMIKAREEIKGDKALQIINEVNIATIEVYSLPHNKLELALKTNKDAVLSTGGKSTPESTSAARSTSGTEVRQTAKRQRQQLQRRSVQSRQPQQPQQKTERIASITTGKPVASLETDLNRYLSSISMFTGIIQAEGEDRQALVIVKNGKIVGAEVVYGGEVLKGNVALQLLDFRGKIAVYNENVDRLLRENPEIRILNREELMRKYRIKPPSEDEIERLINDAFGDDEFEETGDGAPKLKIEAAKKHITKLIEPGKENVKELLSSVFGRRFFRK